MMHYQKLVANPILFLLVLVGSWIFVPQIAQADTVELNLSIERQPNESYENLLQRAKIFLITATQQKFSQAVHALTGRQNSLKSLSDKDSSNLC